MVNSVEKMSLIARFMVSEKRFTMISRLKSELVFKTRVEPFISTGSQSSNQVEMAVSVRCSPSTPSTACHISFSEFTLISVSSFFRKLPHF